MAVDNIEEKLALITSQEISGWLDDAKYRIENERWLKHSQTIALRILRTLRAKNMSQKELAEKIGVSPQQVNKIVKGRENLTLETIANLETALDVVLLTLPPSILPPEPKKSTAKKFGTKTVNVLQKGGVTEKVHEAGSGYGKKARKKVNIREV